MHMFLTFEQIFFARNYSGTIVWGWHPSKKLSPERGSL